MTSQGDEQRFRLELTLKQGYEFLADFMQEGVSSVLLDEPPPLGEGRGPNAARVLAAAVGNCLGASLLYCLRKAHIEVRGLRVAVECTLARNERGRLRIGAVSVKLAPDVPAQERERMGRCLDLFEDFCIVTGSVRRGIKVDAEVEGAPVGAAL